MKRLKYRHIVLIFCMLHMISFGLFFITISNLVISFFYSFLTTLVLIEIGLRAIHSSHDLKVCSTKQKKYTPFIKSHPYLPFVYKEDVLIPMLPKYQYEFMQDNYSFPEIRTNNRGHLNGPNGDRSVIIPPREGIIRISSLGDSVAANYVQKDGVNYNFAVEVERQAIKLLNNSNIEVNNCAIGGYTLLDILVKFLIKDIQEHPSYIVLNHGYSNLRSYLCSQYCSDNTHYRKSFCVGERRYKIAQWIPFKSFQTYKFFFSPWLPSNLKDFLKFVSVDDFNIDSSWKGLDVFEFNLVNLINLARANDIDVVLCTCPHFLHEEIMHSKGHIKFHEGMQIQNEIIRRVARKMSVHLVDNEKIIEADKINFIDSIHMSPIGMQKAAKGVSKLIVSLIRARTNLT